MRESKFRVWDKKRKRMFIATTINASGSVSVFIDDELYLLPAEQIEPMQYTGLKDKNGKEIYEGDIVLDYYDGDDAFIVEWDEDTASFRLTGTDNIASVSFDNFYSDEDLEVIGNVHENANLLGEKE